MAEYTLKNIPPDIYQRAQAAAESNFRSLNQKIIFRLNRSFDAEEIRVSALHAKWVLEALESDPTKPLVIKDLNDAFATRRAKGSQKARQVKVIYRPLFLTDVTECADYLASEAGTTIAAQHIRKVPKIGRLRQDLPNPGVRTLNLRKYPKYLVFYRIEKGRIEMLRVRHGMMNLPELFSESSST